MYKTLYTAVMASALSLWVAAPVGAAGMLDGIQSAATKHLGGGESAGSSASASGLGGLTGGSAGIGSALGLPSLGGDTAGNAAGVLQYCIQNKYLGATDAAGVKDKLLDKAGLGGAGKQEQDAGYQQGLAGVLSGSDGSSFDLARIKGDLKDKACDYVLENASSLI